MLRNWQDHGLVHLKGKLITNLGGYEIDTYPAVYPGMSPVFLYPVYFVTQTFAWTGLNTIAYQALLLVTIFWGIRKLLVQSAFSTAIASIALLSPGYMRWTVIIDPNCLSILPAIPYAALAIAILRRPPFTAAKATILIVTTMVFMSLNWSTAWVYASLICLFLGTSKISRSGIISIVATMFVFTPLLLIVSVAAKASGSSASLAEILGSYTWGSRGYGENLTTGRAFLRLSFVCFISLFPLWITFFVAVVSRIRKAGNVSVLMLAPLAFTLVDVVVMRNYFGHHPWMAGPLILIGLIFSLALLLAPAPEEVDEKYPLEISLRSTAALAVICFCYGLTVLMFFRANEMSLLNVTKLVRQNSVRTNTIVFVRDVDPETAKIAERLSEVLDRHVETVDHLQAIADPTSNRLILSAVKLDDSFKLIAQKSIQSQSWSKKIIDWFNHTISKRNPGDRLELADTYFLYSASR